MKHIIKRLKAAVEAFKAAKVPDPYCAKVHGKDQQGKKLTITINNPMAISDIAGLTEFREFSSVSEVEYYDPTYNLIPQHFYRKPRHDRMAGKPMAFPKPKVLAKDLIPGSISTYPLIGVIDDDSLKGEVAPYYKDSKFGWNDPDLGEIFKKIDMLKAKADKPPAKKKTLVKRGKK